MNPAGDGLSEATELIQRVCNGQATAVEVARLDQLLAVDDAAVQCYVEYLDTESQLLCQPASEAAVATEGSGFRVQGSDTASHSDGAAVELPYPPLHPPAILSTLHYPLSTTNSFVGSLLFSYLVAALVVGMGLLVGSMWKLPDYRQVARQSSTIQAPLPAVQPVVGRITGMVDCRFAEGSGFGVQGSGLRGQVSELPSPAGRGAGGEGGPSPESRVPSPQSPVSLGDRFALLSGLLEITYDSGAKVILQGPVTYEVEARDGGYLAVGKLTARVAKNDECRMINDGLQAEKNGIHHSSFITHHLFSVRTPTATVTDLGTEFGVEVARSGETTSHVFRGSVRVQAVAADGQTLDDGRILRENESVRVESGTERKIVVVRTPKPSHFVREIPRRTIKALDLADVVAGGDGFSGKRNTGIDPTNGRVLFNQKPDPHYASLSGDGMYHRVEGLPFVDGVFIPDGSRGPVQTDSAGHTFDGFLATANGTSGLVWAGGAILTDSPTPIPADLNGVDYSKPNHGLISLHADKAVTFNLDAIRQANPGYMLRRFLAVAGSTGEGLVDLRVIIDGQSRFQRRQVSNEHGAFTVSIPIAHKDRFLTLAATDGGDGIAGDLVVFGDPRLEMAPAGANGTEGHLQPK